MFISFWRSMNTSLDRVFYDTGSLATDERVELSQHIDPEGMVLIVHPAKANAPIRALRSPEFVQEQLGSGQAVETIVVAGVGSSALGTASLARDVADYLGKPVAGIVSGLGLADVATEAWGGWFVFGKANIERDEIATALKAAQVKDHVRHQPSHEAIKAQFADNGISEGFLYGCPDSTALLYILSSLGPKVKLLVGHSKGNYSIENALEGLLQESAATGKPVHGKLMIVTIGAAIWFPPEFTNVHQVLGLVDSLGILNSRWNVERTWLAWTWHSTNAALLGYTSVPQALKLAGVKN
ncbi:MAG: hypothetical protein ACTHN5_16595 [Phycisphaerae bacterium]